jgi:hypothetical protein
VSEPRIRAERYVCRYIFQGTMNRCEAAPEHPVHIYGQWHGPEEYHAFVPADATPPAAPLDVRSPEFRAAVQSVFEAPGEWGPAKGYYGRDIDHFIDMLDNRLSDSKEPPTGKEGE